MESNLLPLKDEMENASRESAQIEHVSDAAAGEDLLEEAIDPQSADLLHRRRIAKFGK